MTVPSLAEKAEPHRTCRRAVSARLIARSALTEQAVEQPQGQFKELALLICEVPEHLLRDRFSCPCISVLDEVEDNTEGLALLPLVKDMSAVRFVV
jgi:hypothetical protein